MRLSTKGRYAVMAMVDLASHSNGQPVPLADIAERQEISLSYLEQLFAKLRRGGLVKSVRGPGGGYLLAYDRDATRIGDIILAKQQGVLETLNALSKLAEVPADFEDDQPPESELYPDPLDELEETNNRTRPRKRK